MGSSEVGSHYFPKRDGVEQSTPLSDGEVIRNLCPDYLAMGMSMDEYWNGDAELPKYYREADRLKRIRANHDAWLHGLYIYNALGAVSPLFHDLIKNPQAEKYLSEPFDLYPKKLPKQMEQQIEDEKELANQEILKAWFAKVNRLKAEQKGGITNG